MEQQSQITSLEEGESMDVIDFDDPTADAKLEEMLHAEVAPIHRVMSPQARGKRESLLNQAALDLFQLPKDTDSGERTQLNATIAIYILELIAPSSSEDVSAFYEANLVERYNPYVKGPDSPPVPFVPYLYLRLRYLRNTRLQWESPIRKRDATPEELDADPTTPIIKESRFVTLNEPGQMDTAKTQGKHNGTTETLTDDIQRQMTLDAISLAFISVCINFKSALRGVADNQGRITHFRNFIVERLVCVLSQRQSDKEMAVYQQREQELFEAMNQRFVDFIALFDCNTIRDLAYIQFKPKWHPGNKIEGAIPSFPATTFIGYFQEVEDCIVANSTISTQRTAFKALLHAEMNLEI